MSESTEPKSYDVARAALTALMTEHAITVDAVFVPWSKSRNAKPKPAIADRSLNWRVTLKRNGHDVYASDYSAGIGHCPSYKQGRMTTDMASAITFETEHGKRAFVTASFGVVAAGAFGGKTKPIIVDAVDVLSSFLLDAEAIDYPTYDDWASNFGYDVDSRKGEAIYRVCLACGLALRAHLGDTLMTQLRDLAREL